MRWVLAASIITSVAAVVSARAGGQALRNPNGRNTNVPPRTRAHPGVPFDKWTRDGPVANKFDNADTQSMYDKSHDQWMDGWRPRDRNKGNANQSDESEYRVNGTAIPDVDFDIGEAYAGQMSISQDLNGPDKFYFWFQPSPNPEADKEIVIWLNGGVSSIVSSPSAAPAFRS